MINQKRKISTKKEFDYYFNLFFREEKVKDSSKANFSSRVTDCKSFNKQSIGTFKAGAIENMLKEFDIDEPVLICVLDSFNYTNKSSLIHLKYLSHDFIESFFNELFCSKEMSQNIIIKQMLNENFIIKKWDYFKYYADYILKYQILTEEFINKYENYFSEIPSNTFTIFHYDGSIDLSNININGIDEGVGAAENAGMEVWIPPL